MPANDPEPEEIITVETIGKSTSILRATYATSAHVSNQVLLPGAHNLGMHSACHS